MMTDKKLEYDRLLSKVADNLDISKTMRDKAIASYESVGEWLGGCVDNANVRVFPQGSFALGTVVKPLNDKEEYDIDLVCLLEEGQGLSGLEIKHLVGDRLKEHEKYRKMLNGKEGKRCWTLHYDEFHMDVLPCVPKDWIYRDPGFTNIRLTNKLRQNVYTSKFSNPCEYQKWFAERMAVQLFELRTAFAKQYKVDIADVPIYEVKTPLQRAVQLLKRHRDIMYQDVEEEKKDDAPISIIITTLAAHAYENEGTLIEALTSILINMPKHIELRDGEYWIENPSIPEENFADKWNETTNKPKEFFRWLSKVKNDLLVSPLNERGLHRTVELLGASLGDNIVKRSIIDLGNEAKENVDSQNLYIKGLSGGLTTNSTMGTKKVGGHTFFGT